MSIRLKREQLRLYLVLETAMLKHPLETFIPEVIRGGVTAVQLRDKEAPIREKYTTAIRLKELLEGTGVLFCINDRADLMAAVGAPCLHVGVKDIPLPAVQSAFPDAIIGYSCNNTDDLALISRQRPDYFGVGPAFHTGTKKDLRPVIGPDGIAALVSTTDIPAVAIGGISADNAHQLCGKGLAGIAVSSAVCAAADPYAAASALRSIAERL